MSPESLPAPSHERGSFLETAGAAEALRQLEVALGAREPFLLVTGEAGAGKTTLANEAIARWDARVTPAFVAYAALSGAELLEEIVRRLGGQPVQGASRSGLLASFEGVLAEIAARGKVALLIVDDAHSLALQSLEELRLLVNTAQQARLPLEVMLIGLPALAAKLDDPALAALRQRISVRVRLEPLSPGEVRRYLRHRVADGEGDATKRFPRKAGEQIAALSLGLPRRINVLASEALRVAQGAEAASVTPEHVERAAAQLWGALPSRARVAPDDDADEAAPPAQQPPPRARPREEAEVPPAAAAMPTSHDPREWVARFVGDKPFQIGSRAVNPQAWTPLPFEPMPEAAKLQLAAAEVRRKPRAASSSHSRKRGGAPQSLLLGAVAALVVLGALAVVIRAGFLARGHAVTAATAKAAAVTPALPVRVLPAVTTERVRAAAEAPVRVKSATPLESGAAAKGPFTVEVGSSFDVDRALEERDRIQLLTGIEGWVVTSPEGSAEPHRIVLGVYRSHARAIATATMLMHSHTLRSATVVPLPPQTARR